MSVPVTNTPYVWNVHDHEDLAPKARVSTTVWCGLNNGFGLPPASFSANQAGSGWFQKWLTMLYLPPEFGCPRP